MATRDVTMEPHNRCLPMGVPRVTPFPDPFVQNYTHKGPTHLFILHEGNIDSYRQIFMDGRKHPPDPDPRRYGHSIGWWEGDTLVLFPTVGYNDKFWFDCRGHPHTEKLHTVERWTRKDFGNMENRVTIDDPGKLYTKPFTLTFMATLSPPQDELLEYICQENNQYGVGTHVPGSTSTPAKRRNENAGSAESRPRSHPVSALLRAVAARSGSRKSRWAAGRPWPTPRPSGRCRGCRRQDRT